MNRTKENVWRKMQGLPQLRKMEEVVARFQHYIETYDEQPGYEEYTDATFLEDVLYGIGIALSDNYQFGQGHREFKKRLMKHLKEFGEEKDDQA